MKVFKTPASGTSSPRQNATSSESCSSCVSTNSCTTQTLPRTWTLVHTCRIVSGYEMVHRSERVLKAITPLANPKITCGFRNRPFASVVTRAATRVAVPTTRLGVPTPGKATTPSQGTVKANTQSRRRIMLRIESEGDGTASLRRAKKQSERRGSSRRHEVAESRDVFCWSFAVVDIVREEFSTNHASGLNRKNLAMRRLQSAMRSNHEMGT